MIRELYLGCQDRKQLDFALTRDLSTIIQDTFKTAWAFSYSQYYTHTTFTSFRILSKQLGRLVIHNIHILLLHKFFCPGPKGPYKNLVYFNLFMITDFRLTNCAKTGQEYLALYSAAATSTCGLQTKLFISNIPFLLELSLCSHWEPGPLSNLSQ